jgi:hypothetical protein
MKIAIFLLTLAALPLFLGWVAFLVMDFAERQHQRMVEEELVRMIQEQR